MSQPAGGTMPAVPSPLLVGRADELGHIETFVRGAIQHGGALLLPGDPGVGKSVLLQVAATQAQAAGARVLRAAGAQFEEDVSFSTLSQLLQPLLETREQPGDHGAMARLRPLHAEALLSALGWSDVRPASQLVLWTAVLTLIREAAADDPLLIVLDDLQWADPASAAALGYVARRLGDSRAGLIGAARSGEESFFDRAGLPSLEIGPLDETASAALLTEHFPALAPDVRDRLLAEAQGNPLALLELPLSLSAEQRRARSALPPVLPLTRRLLSAFAARVAELPQPTRLLLLLAALDGTGDLAVLGAAAQYDTGQQDPGQLGPAERVGLVRFSEPGGRLVFRHPLVRSAVVEESTVAERQHAHHALARLAELAGRPEQQALHLAQAATGPDEALAGVLGEAAYRTLRRGDPVGAVSMLLRAADLSPAQSDRNRRMMEAAYVGADVTGQLGTAVQLLDAAQRDGPAGSLRAAITAAHVLLNGDGKVDTAHRILAGAISAVLDDTGLDDTGLDDAGLDVTGLGHSANQDPGTKETLAEAMHVLMLTCWFGGSAELWSVFYSSLARLRPRPSLLVLASAVYCDPARATDADLAELDARVSALREETDPSSIVQVADMGGYVDRLTDCREALWRLVRDAREGGAVASGINAMQVLSGEDFREGQWTSAQQLADEGLALSDAHGYALLGWLLKHNQALLAAGRGDEKTARALAGGLAGWAAPRGLGTVIRGVAQIRALAALGQGDFEEAYRQASAVNAPGMFPSHVPQALRTAFDLVEAAARSGRHAEAAEHAAAMLATGLPSISRRLAFLTAGAAAVATPGDALFEAALATPGARRWPFEYARIQLAYGEHLRRAKAKTRASVQLAAALDIFDELGAAPWALRAASELRACGQTRTRGSGELLSAREREIAALAASGLTNKQIGEQLMLSPRTVSDYLYKIFPKLGVTTRAALRDALAELPRPS